MQRRVSDVNRGAVPTPGPQDSILYRIIARATRLQLGTLLRSVGNPRVYIVMFAVMAGALALGTITLMAMLTKMPLLFPPLGPSAFILFTTPLAVQASPRSVIFSHTLAVMGGLFALNCVAFFFPHADLQNPAVLNGPRVISIALAIGIVTVLMEVLRCSHPPAAASALIAAMGYLSEPLQALGLLAAAVLLVCEAILLNRVLAGLPYPLWRLDPQAARSYRSLAGLSGYTRTAWQQLAVRITHRRD